MVKYLLTLLFTAVLLLNNDSLCLWEQDEAAYAGFAFNMLESDNFIIPDFEWSWPHRKPPFHFWLIASCYSLFGYNEFATRIPSVIAILISLGFIFYFTRKLYSEKLANMAGFTFMGSLLIPLYGKISMTDATLLSCFILSYFSALSYLRFQSNKWLLSLFFAVSFGGLTKGPPIFITIGGATLLGFLLSARRWDFLKLLAVIFMSFIPFALWGYWTYLEDGGKFFNWWLDWYILKRASGTIYGQTGWPGYYLFIFIVCFIPWLPFLPDTIRGILKDFMHKRKNSEQWFQFGWIIFGWFVYEILKSKLPSYAFAVIPLWCISLAQVVLDYHKNERRPSIFPIWILGICYVTMAIILLIVRTKIPFQDLDFTVYVLSIFLFIVGLLYIFHFRLSWFQDKLWVLSLIVAFGINFIAWGIAIPSFESTRSFPKKIAETLEAHKRMNKHVFFSCDYSMSSLPVYLSWNSWSYSTASKQDYERSTLDSLTHSKTDLFMLQRRNLHYLEKIKDSFKLTPLYGWISDRGVVDTFFIAERKGFKSPSYGVGKD